MCMDVWRYWMPGTQATALAVLDADIAAAPWAAATLDFLRSALSEKLSRDGKGEILCG